jgi:Tol biopolymer transport system component
VTLPLLATAGDAAAAPAKIRVERVSVGSAEEQANDGSSRPLISGDGRYVAFTSLASTIEPPDLNQSADVFVRDTQQGSTLRVTRSTYHSYVIDMSSDGRYVLFGSQIRPDNGGLEIYVYDRVTSSQERVDVSTAGEAANGPSGPYDAISDDGRYVAFGSSATNLVDGDANGVGGDVYLRDRASGTTTRISPNESDGFCPRSRVSMSADGRYVAFGCYRPFSEPLFVFDRTLGVLDQVSDLGANPSMSDDGRYLAFDDYQDVLVLDRGTGGTVRVSVTGTGAAGNGPSQAPSISGDGRYVAFASLASDLAYHDTDGTYDIFVADRVAGGLVRPDFKSSGGKLTGGNQSPSLSASGRYLAFMSADSLVKGDTNGVSDVFEADLGR